MGGVNQENLGGTNYDVYGSVALGTDYFRASLNDSGWENATGADRKRALISATRLLDKQQWLSSPTDTTTPQPLAFPRIGLVDCDNQPILDTDVPDGICFGAYELANIILQQAADTASAADIQNQPNAGDNIKRERSKNKVDVLETEAETEFFRPSGGFTSNAAPRFPTVVDEYVSCFMAGSLGDAGADSLSFVSGTGFGSHFLNREFNFEGEGLP